MGIVLIDSKSLIPHDLFLGELELPEELPEFPYESEFIQEIENAILKYGGQEGVHLLKEHAIEQKEILESSINQNLSVRYDFT